LPNLKSNGVDFRSIATASGLSANDIGTQYGFASCVSEAEQAIAGADTNLIVIATRHDSHASLATAALNAGKHVFVEKPLAMNDDELDAVLDAATKSSGRLIVGFNRRFSPAAKHAESFFSERQSPISILYRVNAGRIAKDSWIQDPTQGGGRIVGEVCHFIDLMQYLTGSLTIRVFAESVASRDSRVTDHDSVFITLRFADGSTGAIAYLAEGDKALAKERIEIFGGERSCVIDDFRRVSMFAGGRETTKKSIGQDKGQAEEIRAVCEFVRAGGDAPISLDDLATTTRATFRILDSLRTGQPQEVSR
jgi:polar amino acid transport system substrate-binding protein